MRTVRTVSIWSSILYTLLVGLLVLSWQFEAHMWQGWLAVPNMFAPLLFVPFAGLFVLAFWLRSRRVWGCLLVLSALALVSFAGAFTPRPNVVAKGPTVKVLSFNHYFANRDIETIRDLIRRHDADVVGLQETTPLTEAVLGRSFREIYPYQLWNTAGEKATDGTALLSRYPFRTARYDEVLRGETVELDVAGRKVTLINLHFDIPFGGKGKVQSASYDLGRRHAQIASLLATAKRHPRLIVLGDFNLSDREVDYRRLAETFTDAYRESQRGFGYTFPNGRSYRGLPLVPFLRIDYVWLRGLKPLAATRDCRSASDHCALIADITLP